MYIQGGHKVAHQGKYENFKDTKIMESFDLDNRLLVNLLNICKLFVFSCVVLKNQPVKLVYGFQKNL